MTDITVEQEKAFQDAINEILHYCTPLNAQAMVDLSKTKYNFSMLNDGTRSLEHINLSYKTEMKVSDLNFGKSVKLSFELNIKPIKGDES